VYVELLAYPKATRSLVDQFLTRTYIVADFYWTNPYGKRLEPALPPTPRGGDGQGRAPRNFCWWIS
jgi:hypothetical protein